MEQQVTITKINHGFCIESDGKFISELCWHEMLDVLIRLTISRPVIHVQCVGDIQIHYDGLRTYEEELARPYGRFVPLEAIAGLLTHQPELTPFVDKNASPFQRIF